MKDRRKTKAQLLEELDALRQKIVELDEAVLDCRRMEETLRANEKQYRGLVELCPAAIIVHSEGNIDYINTEGAWLLGASNPQELLGRTIWDFIHPKDRDTAKTRARQLLEEEEQLDFIEQKWIRLDGQVIDVVEIGVGGSYQGRRTIQTVFRDITQEKALQQQLIQNERLTYLGELASGLAPETKEPLSALLTAASLLAEDEGEVIGAEQRSLIEVIQREAERLDRVWSSFLQFAHPGPLTRELWNLNHLCEQIVAAVQHHEAAQGKHIQTELAPTIPSLLLDVEQIKQVLWNLILNGLQAMEVGGKLLVSSALRDNEVLLTIQDTGPGIPPEEIERLFEPFYSRKKDGIGLGLAIARRLVSLHGGRIEVESTEGRGTTFTVILPVPSTE